MTKSITFYKYQGTGNDFVITSDIYEVTTSQIQYLCDRKFGIGADGLIVLKQEANADFDMMYYNADGTESFCGNGSRCAVMHAHHLRWIDKSCTFNSNDGVHEAEIEGNLVKLKMHDVMSIEARGADYETNTGSPHYISFANSLDFDIVSKAKTIRYSKEYEKNGINVNFISPLIDALKIRTYERGVEGETLSCGTGVTAAALTEHYSKIGEDGNYLRTIQTQGGELQVSFTVSNGKYIKIFLIGPAVKVFKGEVLL